MEWVKSLKQRYAGMKLIVGRDKLDGIQGVRQKIQAFEAFLDKYPEYHGNVVLIQVALQTTEENRDKAPPSATFSQTPLKSSRDASWKPDRD